MSLPQPTDDELIAASQDIVRAHCGLNNFAEGSAGSAIIALFVDVKRRMGDLLAQAEDARDIETARGTDLDNLGRSFGLTRYPPTKPGADNNAAQVLFTNNSTSLTVSVPAGTAVFAPSDPGTRYYTANTLSLLPGSAGLAFVQGSQAGDTSSAAGGTLTAHNGDGHLSVINILPVLSGSGYETDEEFRFRISRTLAGAILGGSTSASAIETALRSAPGVQDVVLLSPGGGGPGTLDALVLTDAGYTADDDFLTSLQEVMASRAAAGISVTARTPTVLPVDVDIAISASGANAGSLLGTMTAVVQGYINTRSAYVTARKGQSVSGFSSLENATLVYVDLEAALIDAARGTLGGALQGMTVTLSTGVGQRALQGNVVPRSGQVLRSRSVRVTTA